MKVLTVSDCIEPALYNRFDAERFSGVGLILSCGDLPPEYLSFLAHRLDAPLYYVRGNHDIRYDSKSPGGCLNLNGKLVNFNGLNILGLEGSRWYSGGPYQYTEEEMRKKVRQLRATIRRRGGVDIVISHAPPRHIHDAEDRCHRGFTIFRWLIDKYSPRYFIHGHIHAAYSDPSERITVVDKTRVVNSYGHFLFEIENERTPQ
ncbi:MAG: metallophosphoesterase [Desulfobacteraceae bacterium]|jgi:Icc-related predicted phosphoesterase